MHIKNNKINESTYELKHKDYYENHCLFITQ